MSGYRILGLWNNSQYAHARSSQKYLPWSYRSMSGLRWDFRWAWIAGYVLAKIFSASLCDSLDQGCSLRLSGRRDQATPILTPLSTLVAENQRGRSPLFAVLSWTKQ